MMRLTSIKQSILRIPLLGSAARWVAKVPFVHRAMLGEPAFKGSAPFWEDRYVRGGHSGAGSYGRLAQFKAEILNEIVANERIKSVIEFGCGDGAQLELARYPEYVGVDVSQKALEICRERFAQDPTKTFIAATSSEASLTRANLSLSLDVIYHLVEDTVFNTYMRTLFEAATRLVIIYASNHDEQPPAVHVRHREFTSWVTQERPDWEQVGYIANRYPFDPSAPDDTSFADFYIFKPRAR